MMSLDRYMVKFFYLAVFSCVLVTAFLVGCGGGNNPSGTGLASDPNAAGATASGTANLFGRAVNANSEPVPGIKVLLFKQDMTATSGQLISTGKESITRTSGEFFFNDLEPKTYALETAATADYLISSKLARIDAAGTFNAGDLVLIPVTPDPQEDTMDIKGKVIDPLSKKPLSVAQVSLDSGQSTISDAFGIFTLKNIRVGTHRLSVYQPGIASYSSFIEIELKNGNAILNLNGKDYTLSNYDKATNRLFDFTVAAGDWTAPVNIEINPYLHVSGALAGTVKQFKIVNGAVTSEEEFKGDFEFDIWVYDPKTALARKSHTVVSNKNDGTWRLDNLPPFEDNGYLWFAVPLNTQVTVLQGQSGNALEFKNLSAEWADRDPVLAYGYKVQSGQTTIMDFTIPSFVTNNQEPSVTKITNASFTDLLNNEITRVALTEEILFGWTGPGTATAVILEFSRIYKNPTVPVVTKSFTFPPTASASTYLHSYKLTPSDYGLDYGRFTWITKAVDPYIDYVAISDSKSLAVVPSGMDISPSDGSTILINQVATYTVNFIAPIDSEAKYVVMELDYFDSVNAPFDTSYNGVAGTWKQLGTLEEQDITENAIFNMRFSPKTPATGQYRWRAKYIYDDGPSLDSNYSYIKFQP